MFNVHSQYLRFFLRQSEDLADIEEAFTFLYGKIKRDEDIKQHVQPFLDLQNAKSNRIDKYLDKSQKHNLPKSGK